MSTRSAMATQWLFRAYSDQSQGTNSTTLFAPAAASSATTYNPPTAVLPRQLNDALSWKKDKPSVLVFFTPSMLFAVAVASKKYYDGETNVRIACFRVAKATTVDGQAVRFQVASDMAKALGVEKRNKDGSVQDYSDAVVATTCVKPGPDVRVARFEDLLSNGLYSLYPSLEKNRRERRPRLNFVILSSRGFGWTHVRALSEAQVSIAAHLATSFRHSSEVVRVEGHILAHLLAFQKRSPTDHALTSWLKKHSQEVITLDGDEADLRRPRTTSDIPEVAQYQALAVILANKDFLNTALSSNRSIPSSLVRQEWDSFTAWELQRRAQYRVANPRKEHDAIRRHSRRERDVASDPLVRRPRKDYSHRAERPTGERRERPRYDTREPENGEPSRRRYLGREGRGRVRHGHRY